MRTLAFGNRIIRFPRRPARGLCQNLPGTGPAAAYAIMEAATTGPHTDGPPYTTDTMKRPP